MKEIVEAYLGDKVAQAAIKDTGRIAGPKILRTSTSPPPLHLPMDLTVREAASSPSIILEAARLTFPFAVGEGVFEVKALTRDVTFPKAFSLLRATVP